MNPRYPSEYTRLPIAHLRPLGHLSRGRIALNNEGNREKTEAPCPRFPVAERGGFEPPEPRGFNGFRDRPIQPLSHLSNKKSEAKRIRTSDLQIRNLKLYPAEL